VERIPDLEKQLYDTKQKLENLQALLDIVSAKVSWESSAKKYVTATYFDIVYDSAVNKCLYFIG